MGTYREWNAMGSKTIVLGLDNEMYETEELAE